MKEDKQGNQTFYDLHFALHDAGNDIDSIRSLVKEQLKITNNHVYRAKLSAFANPKNYGGRFKDLRRFMKRDIKSSSTKEGTPIGQEELGHSSTVPEFELIDSGLEGSERLRLHLDRERNRRIVEKKKADTLAKTGTLACEVCSFNFEKVYGELGKNFCEVHHLFPLSEAVSEEVLTKLRDLAIVCANCHRMLHREPWTDVTSLRLLVDEIDKAINK